MPRKKTADREVDTQAIAATRAQDELMPRLKRFTVKGIFEIGMHEYDSALALIHLDDAGKLFRLDAPAGLSVPTPISYDLSLPFLARNIAFCGVVKRGYIVFRLILDGS